MLALVTNVGTGTASVPPWLYHSSLECEEDQRDAFLRPVGGHEALHRKAESLLANHPQSSELH